MVMKYFKVELNSSLMQSTAWLMELWPSRPLKANPGPSMLQKEEEMMVKSPNAIVDVVIIIYVILRSSGAFVLHVVVDIAP